MHVRVGGIDDHVLSMRRNTTAKSPGESSAGQSSRRSSGEEELLAGQQEQHDFHVRGHLGRRNAGTFSRIVTGKSVCEVLHVHGLRGKRRHQLGEEFVAQDVVGSHGLLGRLSGESIARSVTSSASGARTHLQLVLAGMPSRMCWHSRTHVCTSQDPPTRTSRTGTTSLSRSESRA